MVLTNYNRSNRILFVFALSMLITSCRYFSSKNDNRELARVHDHYLYKADIEGVIPKNTNSEDSLQMATNFIANWVKQQLILKKAELNLGPEKKNVEKQLEEYKSSLIIYLYEEELVKQKLDTNVSESEIEKYYEENKNN